MRPALGFSVSRRPMSFRWGPWGLRQLQRWQGADRRTAPGIFGRWGAAAPRWGHPGRKAWWSPQRYRLRMRRAEHLCPQQRDPRAVITANDFRLLTDGLEQAEVIGHGLMILRNCASLQLRALVAEQLRVSWEVFDEHARAPPPRFLGNALLLAAVRDLEARGDLRVVPPDSPLLKKGKLLGQVGTQGGGGGEGFAVPPRTFFAVPPQPLAIPDSARGTGEPPSWIGEVVRASVESALKGFGPGSGFGGGGDDAKEGHLAAVKRAKLENLNVGQPLAESVAAAQLTLQRLANAATQECKQAMSADKTFDHAHGLQASLHTVRDQALAKSAYGSKSRSTTFEAFGDYIQYSVFSAHEPSVQDLSPSCRF